MERFKDIIKLNSGIGCTIEDYEFIYGLTALLRPRTIVEIGTNTGVSSIVMALALKENNIDGKIYTFDISKDWIEVARKQIKEMKLEIYINSFLGNSSHARHLNIREYDLAFIDGDHTYEGVKKDFENLKDRAKYILFHDTQSCEGVTKFISELKGEKLSFKRKIRGNVYNMGEFKTSASFPGFTLWRRK